MSQCARSSLPDFSSLFASDRILNPPMVVAPGGGGWALQHSAR